jgi:toxin ParE1/3/4
VKLTLLVEAELEGAEAAIWYDDQREGLGDDFLKELRRALDEIGRAPQASALLESYLGRYEIRRYQLKRFPYLVIYSSEATECIVVCAFGKRA